MKIKNRKSDSQIGFKIDISNCNLLVKIQLFVFLENNLRFLK